MYSSADIAAQVAASQQMTMQQAAYARSISPMSFAAGTATPAGYGAYSEQLVHGGFQNAMAGASLGMGALSIAGGMGMLGRAGHALDPFSAMTSVGRAGFAAGRGMGMGVVGSAGMGLAATGGLALAGYGAYRAVGAYTGAFSGGMQEQAALNSTLRSNFNHFGGNGQMGMGFSQREMGSIGNMLGGELRGNSMTSMNELNSLIGMGAQGGQFTGVKDVQDFTRNFKKMLGTLKEVQKELGGSLRDAMQFIDSAKQSGVFQQVDQLRYAAGIRTAEATSGLTRGELMGLSAQGAQIARGVGGLGRQGAMGALRGASQLGAAISSGVINEEALSEMTGGLTGGSAIQAATMQLMQSNASFTRRSRGRYTIFGLSNADGTGMDADAMDALMSGEMTTGQLARRAHRNVRGMGRARAMNQEGQLRGAFLEEGGLAGQLGLLRSRIGSRIMDGGDERVQAYLQRAMRMSGSQAEVMTSLLRNQGTIASEQLMSSTGSARANAIAQDAEQFQSLDAFKRELGHSLSNASGVTAAREAGRRFLSSLSSMTEKALSDLLGGVGESLNGRDARAMTSFQTGNATLQQMRRVAEMSRMGSESGRGIDIDYRGGMMMNAVHALGGHGGRRTIREVFASRGMDAASMSQSQIHEEVTAMRMASNGVVMGAEANQHLAAMRADPMAASAAIQQARAQAIAATGNAANYRQFLNTSVSANTVDAFRAGLGHRPDDSIGGAQLLGMGTQHLTGANIMGDLRRLAGGAGRGAAAGGLLGGPMGAALGGIVGAAGRAGSAVLSAMRGDVTGFATIDGLIGERDRALTGLTGMMQRRSDGSAILRNAVAGGHTLTGVRGQINRAMLGAQHFMGMGENRGLDWDGGQLEALMANEDVRNNFQAMLSGDSEAAQRLHGLAGTMPELGDHLSSLVHTRSQLSGSRLRDFDARIGVLSRQSPEQAEAIRARNAEMAGMYGTGANILSGLGGGSTESLAQLRARRGATGAAGMMTGVDSARLAMLEMQEGFTSGMSGEDAQSRYYALADSLAGMAPEERSQMLRQATLGGDEQTTGMLRGMTMLGRRRAQQQRDLSGQGRRGRRGAVEEAFNLATGGTFGQMGLTDGRGRRIRDASQFLRLVQAGGEEGTDLMDSFRQGMERFGMSGSTADDLIRMSTNQGRGSPVFDQSEIDSLRNTALDDKQRGASERAQTERQRAQNPLDAQRNDVLNQILDAVKTSTQQTVGALGEVGMAVNGTTTAVRENAGPGETE